MLKKVAVKTKQGSGIIGIFEACQWRPWRGYCGHACFGTDRIRWQRWKPLMAPPSSDILPPLMKDSDNDEEGRAAFLSDNNAQSFGDNFKTIQQVAEILSLDPSCKCFGPCGGKTCKERDQWHLCRNNFNDFVKCKNIVGEQCQMSHDGYCIICIIAGSTASKRFLSINFLFTNLCWSCYYLRI